ncbi:MAG: hypothetical protein JSR46_04275 [Verrucomicrobia bacterium]|nr:hypothetical protein [Verrucomicrobiota bacterium]
MTELSFPLHLGALLGDTLITAVSVYYLKTSFPSIDNVGSELLVGTGLGFAANMLMLQGLSTNLWLSHAIAGAFIGTSFYSLFVQVLADLIIWWWSQEHM